MVPVSRSLLAERVGFEPTKSLHPRRFSSACQEWTGGDSCTSLHAQPRSDGVEGIGQAWTPIALTRCLMWAWLGDKGEWVGLAPPDGSRGARPTFVIGGVDVLVMELLAA